MLGYPLHRLKKNIALSSGSNNTSQPLNIGGQPDLYSQISGNNVSTPYAPITDPELRQETRNRDIDAVNQTQQRKQDISTKLTKIRSELDPATTAGFDKAIDLASRQPQDNIRGSKEDQEHYQFMQSPIGKVLGTVAYLGSKATKGTLQVAKGAAHYANMAVNPGGAAAGLNPLDKTFEKADESANYGLTRGDQSRMDESKVLSNIGGLVEFAPAAAASASTGGATLFLQGAGQAQEQLEQAQKNSGQAINPLVKEAFIGGTGLVNKFLMHDLAGGIFNKLPAGLRGDIAAKISADVIKEASGKELTGEAFNNLLQSGAREWADKVSKTGIQALQGTAKAGLDLSALATSNFLLRKGVDQTTDKPVFNDNPADLAQTITEIATQTAPMFGAFGVSGRVAGDAINGVRNIPALLMGNESKLSPYSNYKNTVVESLMHDPSEANVERVKQDLVDHNRSQDPSQQWTRDEVDATVAQVDKIADVAKKLPRGIPANKMVDAVDLVKGREELKQQLGELQKQRSQLDESVNQEPGAGEQLLIDKIDQANDKLKDIVNGTKTTYSIEKGEDGKEDKFFKKQGGKVEPIEESRYNLENLERTAKTKTNEQPIESPPIENTIPETPQTNETGVPETIGEKPVEATENNVAPIEITPPPIEISKPEVNEPTNTGTVEPINEQVQQPEITAPETIPTEETVPKGDKTVQVQNEPIGITKEETKKQREIRGLENLPDAEKTTLSKMFDEGKEAVQSGQVDPRKLATEVSDKPRNLSPVEVNALLHDRQAIREQSDAIRGQIEDLLVKESKDSNFDNLLNGTSESMQVLQDRQRFLDAALDNNEKALRGGANQNALALVAMQNMINADYTLSEQRSRMRVKAGGELTKAMEAELERYDKELKQAKEEVKAWEQKFNDKLANQEVEKAKREARSVKKTETKEVLQTQRKAIVDDFRAELKRMRQSGEFNDVVKATAEFLKAATPFMVRMVGNLAKEGIVEFKDVIARIHDEFKDDIENLSKGDVRDVLAGIYKERKETKNDLLEQRNAIIKTAKLTRELERLKEGLKSEKSEKRLVKKRDEIAKLEAEIKTLKSMAREKELPEKQRKSYVKQLTKSISELDEQISKGEKDKVDKTDKYQDDVEINRLREVRKSKVDELNEIDPRQADEARLSQAIKATEKSITDLEQRIKDKNLHRTKEVKEYNSPELKKLRDKREQLSKEYQELKKKEYTPEQRSKQSLERRLKNLTERIKNEDFEKPEKRPNVELDPEAITLQAKLQRAKNNFDAMANRLSSHTESRLDKTLSTIQQVRRFMLLSGVKTLGKLYAFAADRTVTTPIEELANTLNSKIPFLRKIAQRSPRFSGGIDPKAEAKAITTRISKATLKDSWVDVLKTGVGEIDRVYGKHGVDKDFDLNPSALEFFGRLHGAFKNSTKRAEFFRSMQKRLQHAAEQGKDINDPNIQFATGLEAYADAKRAILMNDNILVDKGYKSLLRGLEQGDNNQAGKVFAAVIRGLFPIVKIPTNYVVESFDVATLGTRAIPKIIQAMVKGADSLSPKEADMVMRTIAKGQIGLALMMYAYANPKMFGGYYSGKRDEKDLKAGDIIVGGYHLPHFMAHNPYFEAMQMAATMRRAIDTANGNGAPKGIMDNLTTHKRNELTSMAVKKADKDNPDSQLVEVQDGKQLYQVYLKGNKITSIVKEGGIKQGLNQSAKGLLEQIPFTSIGDLTSSTSSPATAVGSVVKNLTEPRFVQEIAEWTDRKDGEQVKRDPQGFSEQLKSGLPGLRQYVTEKEGKVDKKVSTIHLPASDGEPEQVLQLPADVIAERTKLNQEFLKDKGALIRAYLKNYNLTEHDIVKRLDNIANDYSAPIIYRKYKDSLKEADE